MSVTSRDKVCHQVRTLLLNQPKPPPMLPRRNDDDKGSISNTENETQLELLTIFFLITFFLRKKVERMVGILAQVDDIFSWASRGEKLIGTGWGMRIQSHGYQHLMYSGRCNIRRSARGQREHGFLLDQHY
jgi:hypothetical protein